MHKRSTQMTNLHKFLMAGFLCLLSFTTANAASWAGATSEPTTKIVNDTTYYVITTAEELAWFATQVNSGNTEINAILGNDIVVREETINVTNYTSSPRWIPIGKNADYEYKGIFDGANFSISGIGTDQRYYVGLFGFVAAKGIVKNITLKNGYGNAGDVNEDYGGMVARNKGLIQNCTNYMTFVGNKYSGGIAGQNEGTIENCINYGTISNDNSGFSGGIVGRNYGIVAHCVNSGTINGIYAGGIVGHNAYSAAADGIITFCRNSGNVTGTSDVGGIASWNDGIIKFCSSDAVITRSASGSFSIGTIVGVNYWKIQDCYSSGSIVSSSGQLGGIAGWFEKHRDSVSMQNVFTFQTSKNNGILGNAASAANGKIECAYYDKDLNTNSTAAPTSISLINVAGKTTAEMQSDQFVWILNTNNGTVANSGVWTREDGINNGYPFFADSTSLPTYKVTMNNDGEISTRYVKDTVFSLKSSPSAASGYIFVAWLDDNDNVFTSPYRLSGDLNLTALYVEESKPQFVITFKDAGASTITTLLTGTDSLISAFPSAPDAATGMEFAGWLADDGTYVTDTTKFKKNTTVTATYKALTYAITFLKAADDTLSKQVEPYGTLPVYTGKTPAMTATAKYSYTFKGWNPAIDTVRSAAEYLAIFDSTLRSYTVKVIALQDTLLTYSADYGTEITLPGAVNRTGYTFSGWYNTSKEKLGAPGEKISLTGDLIIVAGLTANTYTIAFKNGSTTLQTSSVAYGEIPEYTGATPVQAADATYTYAFSGWTPAITMVTGTATYTATFNATRLSSSSSAGSSSAVSSSSEFSSSSESPTFTGNISASRFALSVAGRVLNVQNAAANSRYAVMDAQGRVLFQGIAQSKEFTLTLPRSGAYFVRIGAVTKAVRVRE